MHEILARYSILGFSVFLLWVWRIIDCVLFEGFDVLLNLKLFAHFTMYEYHQLRT